ncbi:hypothetical protein Bca52824_053405 [Brassica carinata]|uniref:Uncharacterized protein n=1 Tax=Brassica carinata TaxID=52824 RepID=A0A8X7R577_BRACI|nr:hypothetical protein Bca52824_053405 [Brassica carinata]
MINRPATSASMNPVRTLGPAIAANNYRAIWVYLTAPILGALIGAGTPATSASMNPVRTLGPAIAANNYRAIWVYLTAPILGALIGAGTYTVVKLPEEDEEHKEKRSFRR